MNTGNQHWEKLNRYVDGELPAASSARIAAQAAADDSAAGSIATLHAIKNALGEAYQHETVIVAAPARRSGRKHWLRIAACIALVSGVIGIGAIWQADLVGGMRLVRVDDASLPPAAEELPAWTAGIMRGARVDVPDISAAGLTAAFVENTIAANGVSMTHIGYLGHHGCRLSLYIAPKTAGGEVSSFFPGRQLQIADWHSDTSRYFTVASGMNDARFAVVTAALKAATTGTRSFDSTLRLALAAAHQPCAS